MKTSDIIIVHPVSDDKFEALKAVMKALKIKFEVRDKREYKRDFVELIQQGDIDRKNGKGRKITLDELDELWK